MAATTDHLMASRRAFRREAYGMALYVAIVLDAALLTLDPRGITALQLIWGTCLGLVLAHLFAFALAARLAGGGQRDREDLELALAQLTGAVLIAALATLPLLLMGEENELLGVELVLSACIGVAAYGVRGRKGPCLGFRRRGPGDRQCHSRGQERVSGPLTVCSPSDNVAVLRGTRSSATVGDAHTTRRRHG